MPAKQIMPLWKRIAGSGYFLNLALLAAACVIFTLQAVAYRYISDDAFISFRYAQNWARGHGPVYNIGEPVEGYTNFLWMAILAGLHVLGIDLVTAARALGIAFGLAAILLTFKFSLRWHPSSSLWAVLAAGLLSINLSFAAWATGGLETHLFTFLVLLSALLHLQEVDDPSRLPWSALTMALCVMTRPDGAIFVIVAGVHRLWSHRGRVTRQDILWGSAFALLYGPYYLWRFLYYGFPFPNTFYAKYGGGPERLLRGFEHVAGYVLEYGGWVFGILAIVLAILGKLGPDCTFLALLTAGYMVYVCWIGGDALIEYRFLLPVTPLLYLLIQQTLWRAQELAAQWLRTLTKKPGWAVSAFVSVMLLALILPLLAQPSVRRSRERIVRDRISNENFAAIGKWFREQVPAEASLAVHHAGAIPFYSELATIDMYGLNDSHIAHRAMPDMGTGYPGHEKHDADYVLSLRPTYIAPMPLRNRVFDLRYWRRFVDNLWFPDIKDMLDSPVFQSLYTPRSVDLTGYVPPGQGTVLNFFQLRDASLAHIQKSVWDLGKESTSAGWQPWAGLEIKEVTQSSVILNSTDIDPFMGISGLQLWTTPCDRLTVRMRLTAGTEAQVFWLNELAPDGSEFQSLKFEVEPDGAFHVYGLSVGDEPSWAGTITGLRLDPTNQPSEIEIDYISLERACETGL